MSLSPLDLMKIQFISTDNNNNRSQTQRYLESSWSSSQCQWRVSISGWRRPSCICCLCNDSQLKSSPEAPSLKPFFPPGHGWTVEAFVGGKVDPLQTSRRPRDIVVTAAAGGLGSGQAGLDSEHKVDGESPCLVWRQWCHLPGVWPWRASGCRSSVSGLGRERSGGRREEAGQTSWEAWKLWRPSES